MLVEVGKGFFMVAKLGNGSFIRREWRILKLPQRRKWVSYEETMALNPQLEVLDLKNQGWDLLRDGFGVLSEEMKGFLWWKEEKELKMEGTDCCEQ